MKLKILPQLLDLIPKVLPIKQLVYYNDFLLNTIIDICACLTQTRKMIFSKIAACVKPVISTFSEEESRGIGHISFVQSSSSFNYFVFSNIYCVHLFV